VRGTNVLQQEIQLGQCARVCVEKRWRISEPEEWVCVMLNMEKSQIWDAFVCVRVYVWQEESVWKLHAALR
jgi:hypothetical protein